MALAWFLCPYKQQIGPMGRPSRYCAMDDFTAQIYTTDAGQWTESEVLGGMALVKVRAASATLTTIAGTTGFYRLPAIATIDTSMSSLTTTQRNAITTRILAMGYTQAEIDAVMGNTLALWRQKPWRILLAFIAQRRLTPRWDDVQQQIVLDGAYQGCRPIANVDAEVTA